ncbi:PPA1309 family protein [Nocardioides kribbensis]|uniref:PPA1309 family protein n=1 Tax=Nocardioides kribbensis TaxID=305517 RepID=UPI0032DBF32F
MTPEDPLRGGDVPGGDLPGDDLLDDLSDLDVDPALAAAVLEIEQHVATSGWDQPAHLFALVDTGQLVEHEPALAAAMGLDASTEQGSLTAIEQDQLRPDQLLEQVLETIVWPADVAGCAAVVERFVLPPGADADVPSDPDAAAEFARTHPERQELRIAAGVTRHGSAYCAMRFRSHDDDSKVVGGADLVPALVELLAATLLEDPGEPGADPAPGSAPDPADTSSDTSTDMSNDRSDERDPR